MSSKPNTDGMYGPWSTFGSYHAMRLAAERGQCDVDAIVDQYRAAINERLAGTGFSIVGDQIMGPTMGQKDWVSVVREGIAAVDADALLDAVEGADIKSE